MSITKAPIIGIIRYSCRASFTKSDYFNPKYLDYRLNIFKEVTLKCFQEQTDKDFNIILLHSNNLPQKYKDIFSCFENNNSFLHNVYISDSELEGSEYINAVNETAQYIEFINNMSINFRIDNDDAVPCNFISRLRNYLKPEFYDYVISFPYISIIQRIHKNKYLKQERYFPSNSIGLSYVTKKDDYKTIMTLGDHGRVNKKHPMILLPGNGGIQTINGKNVMNALYFTKVSKMNPESLSAYLNGNNYSAFDFTCLNICKRRIITDTIKKTVNFLRKRKKENIK